MNNYLLCKTCSNKDFDFQKGLICTLTKEKPNYDDSCNDFLMDESIEEENETVLRPNKQRALVAMTLIWVVLLVEIALIIVNVFQYNLIKDAINGTIFFIKEATANDIRVKTVAVIYLVVYIISGITFICWFRRAYYNLGQKVNHLSTTDGWAAGSWFVPIVSLYQPFQMMKELYEETKEILMGKKESLMQPELSTGILSVWWTLWIVNGILSQIIRYYSKGAETMQELLTSTTLHLISGLIGIPLALITVRIISNYSKAEQALIEV